MSVQRSYIFLNHEAIHSFVIEFINFISVKDKRSDHTSSVSFGCGCPFFGPKEGWRAVLFRDLSVRYGF